MHVKMGFLPLLPLLRLNPLLLLQSFHQLLRDVLVGDSLQNLTWGTKAPAFTSVRYAGTNKAILQGMPGGRQGKPQSGRAAAARARGREGSGPVRAGAHTH